MTTSDTCSMMHINTVLCVMEKDNEGYISHVIIKCKNHDNCYYWNQPKWNIEILLHLKHDIVSGHMWHFITRILIKLCYPILLFLLIRPSGSCEEWSIINIFLLMDYAEYQSFPEAIAGEGIYFENSDKRLQTSTKMICFQYFTRYFKNWK